MRLRFVRALNFLRTILPVVCLNYKKKLKLSIPTYNLQCILLSAPGNCTNILISLGSSNWRGFMSAAAFMSSSIGVNGSVGFGAFGSSLVIDLSTGAGSLAAVCRCCNRAEFLNAALMKTRSDWLVSLDMDIRNPLWCRRLRTLSEGKILIPKVAAATSASSSFIIPAAGLLGREWSDVWHSADELVPATECKRSIDPDLVGAVGTKCSVPRQVWHNHIPIGISFSTKGGSLKRNQNQQ